MLESSIPHSSLASLERNWFATAKRSAAASIFAAGGSALVQDNQQKCIKGKV